MELCRSAGNKALRWLNNLRRRHNVRRVAPGIALAVVVLAVIGVPLQQAYAQLGPEPVVTSTSTGQVANAFTTATATTTQPPATSSKAPAPPTQTPTASAVEDSEPAAPVPVFPAV
jgi:hypothetical protein